MSWIRKNPFADGGDPVEHMVSLVAAEAERSGTPLSEAEKEMLLKHWDPETEVPEDFQSRAKKLIEQTLDHEPDPDNPQSFANSIEWAGERAYPMVVALAEEVIIERRKLRGGKRKISDLIQLVGCAIVVVIVMMLAVALLSWLFGRKS